MKKFSAVACIFLATWAAVTVSSGAQTAAPAPYDCTALAYDMMDCVGFLMVGGTERKPRASCCSGLKTLVKANADCLCFAMDLAANLGLAVDITQARALPSSCGVDDKPSFANCHVSDSPGVSPTPATRLLPPPSAVGGAPASAYEYGIDGAPAPAPAPAPFMIDYSGSVVSRPAIFSDIVSIAIVSAILLFINA